MNPETESTKPPKPTLIIQRYSKPYLFEQFNLSRIKIKKKKSFTEVYYSDDEYSSGNYLKRRLNRIDQHCRSTRHSRSVENNLIKSDYEVKDDKLITQTSANCLMDNGDQTNVFTNNRQSDHKPVESIKVDQSTRRAAASEKDETNEEFNSINSELNSSPGESRSNNLNSSRSSLPSPRYYTLPMHRFLFQKITRESTRKPANFLEQNIFANKGKSAKEENELNELKIKLRHQQALLNRSLSNDLERDDYRASINEMDQTMDANDIVDNDSNANNANDEDLNNEEALCNGNTMHDEDAQDEERFLMNRLIERSEVNQYDYEPIYTFDDADELNGTKDEESRSESLEHTDRHLRTTKKHRHQHASDYSDKGFSIRKRSTNRPASEEAYQIVEQISLDLGDGDLGDERLQDEDYLLLHESNDQHIIELHRDELTDDAADSELHANQPYLHSNDDDLESIRKQIRHQNLHRKLYQDSQLNSHQSSCQNNCLDNHRNSFQTACHHQNNKNNLPNACHFKAISHSNGHPITNAIGHSVRQPSNRPNGHRQIGRQFNQQFNQQFDRTNFEQEIEFLVTRNDGAFDQLMNVPATEQTHSHRKSRHDKHRTGHRMKMSMENEKQFHSHQARPPINSLAASHGLTSSLIRSKAINRMSDSSTASHSIATKCLSKYIPTKYDNLTVLETEPTVQSPDCSSYSTTEHYVDGKLHSYYQPDYYTDYPDNYSYNQSNYVDYGPDQFRDYEQFNHQMNHQINHQMNQQMNHQINHPMNHPINHPMNHQMNQNFSANYCKQNCCSNQVNSTFYDSSPFLFVGFYIY